MALPPRDKRCFVPLFDKTSSGGPGTAPWDRFWCVVPGGLASIVRGEARICPGRERRYDRWESAGGGAPTKDLGSASAIASSGASPCGRCRRRRYGSVVDGLREMSTADVARCRFFVCCRSACATGSFAHSSRCRAGSFGPVVTSVLSLHVRGRTRWRIVGDFPTAPA